MKFYVRCPKCGSPNVSEQYPQVTASSSYMVLSDEGSPGEGAHLITAWICMDCGFTELYRSKERTVVPITR